MAITSACLVEDRSSILREGATLPR